MAKKTKARKATKFKSPEYRRRRIGNVWVWVTKLSSGGEIHKAEKDSDMWDAYDAKGNFLGWCTNERTAIKAATTGRMLRLQFQAVSADLDAVWDALGQPIVVTSKGVEIKAFDDNFTFIVRYFDGAHQIMTSTELLNVFWDSAAGLFDLKFKE